LGKKRKPKGYWKYEDNTRNYFVQYANEMGFDPFVASNWEKLTVDQFAAQVKFSNSPPPPSCPT